MFTDALSVAQAIKTKITAPVTALVSTMSFNLDEPINLVYSDLPMVSTYPVREDYNYEESTTTHHKKHLTLRVEIRMAGGPASSTCTPVVNAISDAILGDRTLGGLAQYVELQSIQWANDNTGSGVVSGAAVDILVQYFVS